jgi:redox-sensitive bicupin YhaK (pirin superfamily)
MQTLKSIQQIATSPLVSMGEVRLRQPVPSENIPMVDPFLLLHHYGPYAISPFNNPFDLGPHPHRGFEPITLLLKGEQLHRDSLGNEMLVKAGDVQWTTAGRGIVHAEGPSKEFVEKGGELEGIQLWLNLPAVKKMMPAKYQFLKKELIPLVFNDDKSIELRVIAGEQKGVQGPITTQTAVNVFLGYASSGTMTIDIPQNHQSLVYVLEGEVKVHDSTVLKKGAHQLATFDTDGNAIGLEATENSVFLVLSGAPINEKVASWGPYVMNSQTEIMEALRDYQQGKMGFLY